MSELDLFQNATGGLAPEHFGLTEDGRAYVEAPALARALQHSNPSKMLAVLDDDEKGLTERSTLRGPQRMNIVFEEGLYRLLFRSNLPAARELTKRAAAILRQLRETGVVDVRPRSQQFQIPQDFAEALELAAKQARQISELEPKADLAETFLIADGSTRLVREVAKLLGMQEKELRRFLIAEKLIFPKHAGCGDISYDFYAAHAHHFVAKERIIEHTFGTCSHYTLRVTARGIELIKARLAKAQPPAA